MSYLTSPYLCAVSHKIFNSEQFIIMKSETPRPPLLFILPCKSTLTFSPHSQTIWNCFICVALGVLSFLLQFVQKVVDCSFNFFLLYSATYNQDNNVSPVCSSCYLDSSRQGWLVILKPLFQVRCLLTSWQPLFHQWPSVSIYRPLQIPHVISLLVNASLPTH